jgi:hypothetical protein
MSQAIGLDHAGIVGRDLTALAEAFQAFGFTLTPLARHAGGRTGNRCVMLRDGGYLELLSTVDGGTSATLDRFLARHAGLHILALEIEDIAAVQDRLRLAFGSAPDVSHTDRAVDDAEPDGPRARFALLTPPDPPEGRVHLIRHETRAALWQERFLGHANNAVALTEIVLEAPEPARTAAWYSRLAGRAVTPDPGGGYALPLPRGRVRLTLGTEPRMVGLTLRTGDGNVAIRSRLQEHTIAFREDGDTLCVDIAGVALRFTP